MKKGRPKGITKIQGRQHSVYLSKEAEVLYRKICRENGMQNWFHRWVSATLLRDFGTAVEEAIVLERAELERQRDYLEARIQALADRQREHRQKRISEEIEKAMPRLNDGGNQKEYKQA